MGIGIAIGAFWGWQQFKGLTQKAAGEKALEHLRSDLGKSELLEVVEEISIGFLQAKLRDGTLLGLAEQRNKEKDKFSEVDDAWGDL